MRTSMTSTRSKVKIKVTELLKFGKLHFSGFISSATLAWSSRLMVGYDNMRPTPSLSEPCFWISFSESYHVTSNFAECRYYRTFKGPYFPIASHMVGSPIMYYACWCDLDHGSGEGHISMRNTYRTTSVADHVASRNTDIQHCEVGVISTFREVWSHVIAFWEENLEIGLWQAVD